MTREDGPQRAASAADRTKIAEYQDSRYSAAETSTQARWSL